MLHKVQSISQTFTYSEEEFSGCSVIRGTLSLEVEEALKLKGAVMCPQLARLLNAVAVFGSDECIRDAREKLGISLCPPPQVERMSTIQQMLEWRTRGHVCDSSEAMLQIFLGHPVSEGTLPTSVNELLRCASLLRWAPALQSRIRCLKNQSRGWSQLADSWRLLEILLAKMKPSWSTLNQYPSTTELASEEARVIQSILIDIANSKEG